MASPDAAAMLLEANLSAAVQRELANLDAAAAAPAQRATALAGLVMLVSQLEDGSVLPDGLEGLGPRLGPMALADGSDAHTRANALALLTSLISLSQPLWAQLVVEQGTLVPALVGAFPLAATCGDGNQTLVNLLALLTAVAQKGEQGAQAVISSQGLPHIQGACSCTGERSVQVQEAAADALCQLGAYESCRPAMIEQGCVGTLALLLGSSSNDAHVCALLGLGMLLTRSPPAQLQLARHANVKALLALMQQSPDEDAREIGKDLFKQLAANPNCKSAMATAMRSSVLSA